MPADQVKPQFEITCADDVRFIRALHSELASLSMSRISEPLLDIFRFKKQEVLRSALTRMLSAIEIPKPIPDANQDNITIPVSHNKEETDSKPDLIAFGAWRLSFDNWQGEKNRADWCDAVVEVCEILYLEHSDFFIKLTTGVLGYSRRYFASSREEFGQRDIGQIKKIGTLDWYVDTRLSAPNSRTLIEKLILRFGYSKPNIKFK